MSQSQDVIQRKLEEIRAEKHRIAQQKYYWNKKGESITNALEVERLRNEVSYLEGQLTEKESSRSQLQIQLTERNSMISQLQQQLASKDANISQLQLLLSKCGNGVSDSDISQRLQELTLALTNEIQRTQVCLQTIRQLQAENTMLRIYRDLVVEIYTRYPQAFEAFVHELQQPGKQVSSPELNAWVQQQFKTITK